MTQIRWFVDGKPISAADGKDLFFWQLVKGHHIIMITGMDKRLKIVENSVQIEVY